MWRGRGCLLVSAVNGQQAASDPRFEAAYRSVRGDSSIQFDLAPPPPPVKLPVWIETLGHAVEAILRPIGRAILWIAAHMPDAPYAKILLYGVLLLFVGLIGWAIVDRICSGAWRWPLWRRKTKAEAIAEEEWAPEARTARAWLQEAEALAAQGNYAEAVHHLLRRSVEDIERRRPRLIAPSLTSRDIADHRGVPGNARAIFSNIAHVVERSLFGGRPVGAEDWAAARAAYSDFALGRTWTA
jgi:hypothetical protein